LDSLIVINIFRFAQENRELETLRLPVFYILLEQGIVVVVELEYFSAISQVVFLAAKLALHRSPTTWH